METKTNWRKLYDFRFISAEDLVNETTVKIKSIDKMDAFNGKELEPVNVIHFEGASKGMVLNKTNAKALSKITGSPYIENWVGVEIILYSQIVRAFGQNVPAIRIKSIKEKSVKTADGKTFTTKPEGTK